MTITLQEKCHDDQGVGKEVSFLSVPDNWYNTCVSK